MAPSALRLIAPTTRRTDVGDLVRTGDNSFPQYRVIALNGDRAWLRDVQYGSDHVVSISTVLKA